MKYFLYILLLLSLQSYGQMAGVVASRQKVDRDAHIALVDSGGMAASDTQKLFVAYEAIKRMKGHAHPLGSDASIWDSGQLIRLYIGGTAQAHAFNYKNPTLYKATFVGSPTHNNSGVSYNITTQYENSNFPLNNIGVYNAQISVAMGNQLPASGTNRSLFGFANSNYLIRIIPRITITSAQRTLYNGFDLTTTNYAMPDTNTVAMWTMRVTFNNATTHRRTVFRDATQQASTTATTAAIGADNFFVSALNDNGTASQFAGSTIQFLYAGKLVSSMSTFNDIVQRIKTRLGR
jgi:hypothetical protein